MISSTSLLQINHSGVYAMLVAYWRRFLFQTWFFFSFMRYEVRAGNVDWYAFFDHLKRITEHFTYVTFIYLSLYETMFNGGWRLREL